MEVTVIQPKSYDEIRKHLSHPLSHTSVVILKYDNTNFILNPFGGAVSSTQELKLIDDFELESDELERYVIISNIL